MDQFSNQKAESGQKIKQNHKTQLYAVYQRLTSALRTHIVSKYRMAKDFPCKWKTKEGELLSWYQMK